MTTDDQASFAHEIDPQAEADALPAYAPMQMAYNRACLPELARMIADLPLQSGAQVLDMACGDGTYSVLLAQRVGSSGRVVGLDIAPAYLKLATERAQMEGVADRTLFQLGDIAQLPFPNDTFDLVWCAHSLYSLPDPITALRELRRVVRSGGTVAILENDTLHQMLLPWPVEVELAVRQAQLAAFQQDTPQPGKFYIGRNLCATFREAGLDQCSVTTYTIDRRAPLSEDDRTYLQGYLADVRERSQTYLKPDALQSLNKLLDPQSPDYLLDRPDFFMSQLEIVACGVKP